MKRLLILEGPSGAGKTTFLNRFLEKHDIRNGGRYYTSHFGAAPGDTPEEVAEWYAEILEFCAGAPLILDRWVLSNLVYAHTMGNQTYVGSHQLANLKKRVQFWYGDDVATLVFLANPGTLRARNQGRDREAFDAKMEETVALFWDSIGHGYLNERLINTEKLGPNEAYRYAMEIL